MAEFSKADIERLLGDLVDAVADADDIGNLIALYANAIKDVDAGDLCPETKAWHQVTDGSCDLCGMKNLA